MDVSEFHVLLSACTACALVQAPSTAWTPAVAPARSPAPSRPSTLHYPWQQVQPYKNTHGCVTFPLETLQGLLLLLE